MSVHIPQLEEDEYTVDGAVAARSPSALFAHGFLPMFAARGRRQA